MRAKRLAVAACLLLATGCRQDMHDQAKYEPYEANPFFADGMASRPLPAHAVARGQLREDVELFTGLTASGLPAAAFPLASLRARWPGGEEMADEAFYRVLLKRGERRYGMFCTPCHDRVGTGGGMIVERGFKRPTSFHDERLRNALPGYFVNVMTEGFGQMPSYAAQVEAQDRWAIAAYIRALQLSQHARLAELPADVGQHFEEAVDALPQAEDGHGSEEIDPAEHGADRAGET